MQARLYRPHRSVDLAADVVDKVLATGGALYLHTADSKLAWYQLALLDIYARLAAPWVAAACVGLLACEAAG